jgi:hypothetical protein
MLKKKTSPTSLSTSGTTDCATEPKLTKSLILNCPVPDGIVTLFLRKSNVMIVILLTSIELWTNLSEVQIPKVCLKTTTTAPLQKSKNHTSS